MPDVEIIPIADKKKTIYVRKLYENLLNRGV